MNSKIKRDFIINIIKKFLPKMIISAFLGITSGLMTVYILSSINDIITNQTRVTLNDTMGYTFACLAAIVTAIYSQTISSKTGFEVTAEVRLYLINKIIEAPIESIERYGVHRLTPILAEDINVISSAFFVLAETLVSLTTIIGCMVYLLTLSSDMFFTLLLTLFIGIMIQVYAQSKGVQGFWKARELEDNLYKTYRDITEGAKELKMNRNRRQAIYNSDATPIVNNIRNISTKSIKTYILAMALGHALYFLIIGIILALGHKLQSSLSTISGFVLLLIYLKGPIDQIMSVLPNFGQAKTSLRKIFDLFDSFSNIDTRNTPKNAVKTNINFSSIELQGLAYKFTSTCRSSKREKNDFFIGPINLSFRAGEIVFIVGENGSGKTTLIKLILGLYQPSEGQILLNDRPINDSNRDDYRQIFSAVLSDFYLFDNISSHCSEIKTADDELVLDHLSRLGLSDKVSVKHGVFSTTNLSSGQRKRLALVNAHMEKKPVYIFDEWAADQDPLFRNVFYTKILPKLRDQGKLIIAVSHDDRYFNIADRLVVVNNGKIFKSEIVRHEQ